MSRPTKEQLSYAMVELLQEKPLNKITVGEVARKSNLSRMTFYYHFKDIDTLVKWTFMRRVEETLRESHEEPGWRQGLSALFEVMYKNRDLVSNVYRSIAHDQLYVTAIELLSDNVMGDYDRVARGLDISEQDRSFIASFYMNAIVGICFNWIEAGMEEEAIKPTIERCCLVLKGSVQPVLATFEARNA